MKGLKPKNKIGAAFGSYGWSGEAVKIVAGELEAMKFDLKGEGVRSHYLPGDDDLTACRDLARKIAEALPA
jgi:flavorubredoxin